MRIMHGIAVTYVVRIVQQTQVVMHINMQLKVKAADIIPNMIHKKKKKRYIMMLFMEQSGYRTVRHMMKQSLMDMCVPVEQENKRELVLKFGTTKNHGKVVLFLYLNLKRK